MKLSAGAIAIIVTVIAAIVAAGLFFSEDNILTHFELEQQNNAHPVEIRARWLGMSIVSTQSESAQRMRIPTSTEGVVVAGLVDQDSWRARAAGVSPGDIIVGVDGTPVHDMADLVEMSHRVDVSRAVLIDVSRIGQVLTLVMPAGDPRTLGEVPQIQPGASPGWNTSPQQWNQQFYPAPATTPTISPPPWAQGNMGGLFSCPLHGLRWTRAAVHPHYRCPQCNSPLNQVP